MQGGGGCLFFFFELGWRNRILHEARVRVCCSAARHLQAGTLGPAIRHRTRDSAEHNIGAKETLGKPPAHQRSRIQSNLDSDPSLALSLPRLPPAKGAASGVLRDALLRSDATRHRRLSPYIDRLVARNYPSSSAQHRPALHHDLSIRKVRGDFACVCRTRACSTRP